MHVGILSDFPTPTVLSGPSLHTRFLAQGLTRRRHHVTLMGPDTSDLASSGGLDLHVYKAFSYPTYPKIKFALPLEPRKLWRGVPELDLIHGQTNSHMSHYACYLREMYGVAVLQTQTIHLPTYSHVVVSGKIWGNPVIRTILEQQVLSVERNKAHLYNQGDCLIVQNRYLVDYWRERGVTVPIEIVGRPINPEAFSKQPGEDPFPARAKRGKRLLLVSRHDREKNIEQMIDLFLKEIAPADPDVSLTIIGDGCVHADLVEQAWSEPHGARVFFPGEVNHGELVDWYAHADIFVYTSLSETFGNVINEALWCGLPVVALNDGMGVSHQVIDDVNGFLIEPNRSDTDERFAHACLHLLHNRERHTHMSTAAATFARRTSHPDVVLSRFEAIYERACAHVKKHVRKPLSQQSRAVQMRSFSRHMWSWGAWNAALLAVSHVATRVGVNAEKSKPTQHAYAMAHYTQPEMPARPLHRSIDLAALNVPEDVVELRR